MNRLILAALIALTLGFPFTSYASVNIFGVETPIERTEVKNEYFGGNVANDFNDTLKSQMLRNKNKEIISSQSNDQFIVFGVDLNAKNFI